MGMIVYLRLLPRDQLTSLRSSDEELSEVLYEQGGEVLDLDKAWHGIHYLLTGSDFDSGTSLDFLLLGGEIVGDRGMGPIRTFAPERLKDLSGALEGIDEAELRRRFNPAEMTRRGIYPSDIWSRPPEENESLDYVLYYFGRLKDFLRQGAQRGRGLLVYMS